MTFIDRPMQPEDIPECVKIMGVHPVFGPRYGREIETLPEAWRVGTLDSSEIRHALRKRLGDLSPDVRDEAIWGLARRRDPAALKLLLDRLTSTEWSAGDEMAAAEVLGVDYETPAEALRTGLRNLLSS